MALASLVAPLRAGPAGGAFQIATAYEEVVDAIRSSSVVLILTVSPDPNGAAAEWFVAQHVLAPRMVKQVDDSAAFALTAPGAPPTIDGDSRLRPFELVNVTDTGVRLYRRRY
jgi:hypothetical protein